MPRLCVLSPSSRSSSTRLSCSSFPSLSFRLRPRGTRGIYNLRNDFHSVTIRRRRQIPRNASRDPQLFSVVKMIRAGETRARHQGLAGVEEEAGIAHMHAQSAPTRCGPVRLPRRKQRRREKKRERERERARLEENKEKKKRERINKEGKKWEKKSRRKAEESCYRGIARASPRENLRKSRFSLSVSLSLSLSPSLI